MAAMEQHAFPDARSFRAWLRANHAKAKVLWLAFYKKHTGRKSVSYEDAVRQALCFGWIDSIVKRLDEDRYLQKFTPRTDRAKWSRSNIERALELIKSGEMAEPGYSVLPSRDVSILRKFRPAERPTADRIPGFIVKRFRKDQAARKAFEALPPSHRRNYVGWIMAAKQEETRQRRLERAVAMIKQGKPPLL